MLDMTIDRILERQREVQWHAERVFGRPCKSQVVNALLAEVGEVLSLLKGEYAWWKRHGVGFKVDVDKRVLAEELSDVLHFLAILAVGAYSPCDDGSENTLFARFVDIDPRRAMAEVFSIAKLHGITEADLERAYLDKTRVNLVRWM